MTFGLVHASYSLPEWQAVKLTFFAPCLNQHTLFTLRSLYGFCIIKDINLQYQSCFRLSNHFHILVYQEVVIYA